MLIDINAPQSLLDRLAAQGVVVPTTRRSRAHATLSVKAPGLVLEVTTRVVDPDALAATGTAAVGPPASDPAPTPSASTVSSTPASSPVMRGAPEPDVMPEPRANTVEIRVIPRARRNEIGGSRAGRLVVRTTASPVDGAANDAVRRMLADYFHVRASDIEIISGHRGRDKTVRLNR